MPVDFFDWKARPVARRSSERWRGLFNQVTASEDDNQPLNTPASLRLDVALMAFRHFARNF